MGAEAPSAFGQAAGNAGEGARRPYWTFHRFFVALACALSLLSPALFGSLETYLFIGLMLWPSLLALVLILVKDRAWTYLTATILGSIFPLLVIVLFNVLEGAPNPASRIEYWATVLNVGALLLILFNGITGFRKARAHAAFPSLREGWRAAGGAYAWAVFALMFSAIVSGQFAYGAGSAASGGYDFVPSSQVALVTENLAFSPKELTVPNGTVTEIAVENRDAEGHTFTYMSRGVEYDHELLGGQTTRFLVLFEEPGTVKFWCIPHSGGADDDGSGMVGTITVA